MMSMSDKIFASVVFHRFARDAVGGRVNPGQKADQGCGKSETGSAGAVEMCRY